MLMFQPNKHITSMWRDRKTFLKWYSVALLLAYGDFLQGSVFHEHVYGEHCMTTACTHFTYRACKIYTQGDSAMHAEFCLLINNFGTVQ
jgi:hypothetical protein